LSSAKIFGRALFGYAKIGRDERSYQGQKFGNLIQETTPSQHFFGPDETTEVVGVSRFPPFFKLRKVPEESLVAVFKLRRNFLRVNLWDKFFGVFQKGLHIANAGLVGIFVSPLGYSPQVAGDIKQRHSGFIFFHHKSIISITADGGVLK